MLGTGTNSETTSFTKMKSQQKDGEIGYLSLEEYMVVLAANLGVALALAAV